MACVHRPASLASEGTFPSPDAQLARVLEEEEQGQPLPFLSATPTLTNMDFSESRSQRPTSSAPWKTSRPKLP